MNITFVHDEDMEQVAFYLDGKLLVSGYIYDMMNTSYATRHKTDNLWEKLFGALGVGFCELDLDYETADILMGDSGNYPEDIALLEKISEDPEAARRELRIAQLKRELNELDLEGEEEKFAIVDELKTQRGGMVTFL